MYTYEDFLMLSARYIPCVKSMQDTFYKTKVASDGSIDLIKMGGTAKWYYDRKGNIKMWENFDIVASCSFIYKNNLLVCIKKHEKSVLKLINILKYDDKNRVIEESINEPQKTPNSKYQYIIYDYDKTNEILIRSYSFGFSYDYLQTKIFNNNNNNQIIEDKTEQLNGVREHSKYYYNQKGKRIKELMIVDGKISNIFNSTHYNNGFLKTSGSNYYKYKIDKKGNFIEKIRYNEFGIFSVLKREIEYY